MPIKTKSSYQPGKSDMVYTVPWGEYALDAPVAVVSEFWKAQGITEGKFRAHVLNERTGSEWVDVETVEGLHSFRISQVQLTQPPRVKRKYTRRVKNDDQGN